MRAVVLAVALGAALAAAAGAQERVWVTSAGTKVTAEASPGSKTVAEVAVGAELRVLSTAGKWYRVTTPRGPEGWVYRGKVSTAPPAQGGGLFGALPGSGIRVAAADTSRSIRGLSPEVEQYAQNANAPAAAKAALDRVLLYGVAPADLEAFLREGRVGEYAP